MLLIIDHYDSFVDMIADYCAQLGFKSSIVKTDQIYPELITELAPTHIILGPGPGHPKDQQLIPVWELLSSAVKAKIPVLGICLGHQLIAEFFQAKVLKAQQIAHGIVSLITHNSDQLFAQIPVKFQATRYHSLQVTSESILGTPLCVTALSEQQEIMAIRHHKLAIFGIQFHPESVQSEYGLEILANFLNL